MKAAKQYQFIYERGEIVSFDNKLINQSGYCDGITCSITCASFLARIEHGPIRASHSATQACASASANSRQVISQK